MPQVMCFQMYFFSPGFATMCLLPCTPVKRVIPGKSTDRGRRKSV